MKKLKVAIAGLVLAGGLGVASNADAYATGCQWRTTSTSASVYCSGGDGYYRVKTYQQCPGTTYDGYIYGAWQRPGGFSESYVNVRSGCYRTGLYIQYKY